MEFLKKIGGFVRNHYEKVLLSLVLLGLAAAAAYLPIQINAHKRKLEEIKLRIDRPPVAGKLPKPLDLSTNMATIERVEKLPNLTLTRPHNLLNPVTWKRTPEGRLLKIDTEDKEGPGALKVTKMTP